MNLRSQRDGGTEPGWTRVSSFKPHFAGMALTVAVSAALSVFFQDEAAALPLITAGAAMALGLIALNCKVVHKRGNEYRISSLFYSEVVRVDDVCMTVTRPGPLWTRFRIHLRRPARFGWMISFVPASRMLADSAAELRPNRA